MINLKFWKRKVAGTVPADNRISAESKRLIGTFEVGGELGRGAMGAVYLGRDQLSGREVAIKTINLVNAFNADAPEAAKSRFLREIKILTWLDHPDIVAIYDVGDDNGVAYIAMELVGGVPMEEHATPEKLLPLPKTLEIIARVADALGYAHEQNVVHCDVKPANIMYDAASNTVKVMDFGISRLVNLTASADGMVRGSAPYMSPEHVMRRQIVGQSDLFSLGSTLYKLVSGRSPFEADSAFDIMHRIVEDPPADILSFRPDLPLCICQIINRALTKEMGGRFQSGHEMANAIRQCAETL